MPAVQSGNFLNYILKNQDGLLTSIVNCVPVQLRQYQSHVWIFPIKTFKSIQVDVLTTFYLEI